MKPLTFITYSLFRRRRTKLTYVSPAKVSQKKILCTFSQRNSFVIAARSTKYSSYMSAILQNDVIPLPASISLLPTNFLEFSGNFYLALELLCQDEKATSHSYEALTSPLILATMDPSRIKATSIYGRFSPSDQQFLRRLRRSKKKEVTTSYRKQKKNFNRGKIWLSFSDFQLIIRASEFLTISIQISV